MFSTDHVLAEKIFVQTDEILTGGVEPEDLEIIGLNHDCS